MRDCEEWDELVGGDCLTGDWEDYFDIHPLTRLSQIDSECRHGEIKRECAVCHLEEMDSH